MATVKPLDEEAILTSAAKTKAIVVAEEHNMAGGLGEAVAGLLAPLFQPLGLGDWRVVTALVTGFLAKESVVATLEVLNVTASLTALTAIPMLAFCLLYTPCVAAIAAVKRELSGKWAIWMVVFQCAVAWVVAWLAYLVAGLFF